MAVSADALQVYARARDADRGRERAGAPEARAPADLGRSGRRVVQRRPVRGAGARRDRLAAGRGPAPDRRRRDGPVPARGADRAEPQATAARGGPRTLDRRARAAAARTRCTRCSPSGRRRSAGRIEPGDRQRIVRALELLDAGELDPGTAARRGSVGAVERVGQAADAADRPGHGPRRGCTRGSTRESTQMLAAGAQDEVRQRERRRRVADRAQGARVRGAAGRRRRGDEATHPQLRAPAAHLDAKARGRRA